MNPGPDSRTYLELQPVLPLSAGWQIALLVVVALALGVYVIRIGRRDTAALSSLLTALLITLRLAVVALLIVFVLGVGQRSQSREVTRSRLAILIDTSLSMGLRDATREPESAATSRIGQVVQWLSESAQWEALRQQHGLSIYRVDGPQPPQLLTTLEAASGAPLDADGNTSGGAGRLSDYNRGLLLGWLTILLALGCLLATAFRRTPTGMDLRWLSAGVGLLVLGLAMVGINDLRVPERSCLDFRLTPVAELETAGAADLSVAMAAEDEIDWENQLKLEGTSTALGSAIQSILNRERGQPLAGICLVTDGQSNDGISLGRAATASLNAGVSLFPIGVGSQDRPQNLQLTDVQVPQRVFPGDRFKFRAMIDVSGVDQVSASVSLLEVDADGSETPIDQQLVTVASSESTSVEFETTRDAVGEHEFVVRVEADLPRDRLTDNQRRMTVEAVERKTRVLLMAGGPNRDFRFVRNQLFRDPDVTLHVWLQSATEGADQESDRLLTEFPASRSELQSYDCLIAFDPDWEQLSVEQASWLEDWLADSAGGLILSAGPVNTPEWTRQPPGNPLTDLIRKLYPVAFYSQGTAQLRLGRFGGDTGFPLTFTRAGEASRFLWLGDDAETSRNNWASTAGSFGYYAVNEAKPGAEVLARFSDPQTSVDGDQPIYLASQFYGSGRVFFQASSEVWRIRKQNVQWFQDYYTQLLRWASQGRLLRDSNRGVLLSERDAYWLGEDVVVRALLRDSQDRPLVADSVLAIVTLPDQSTLQLPLKSSGGAARPGTFEGRLVASLEGDYRVSLSIPDGAGFEVLRRSWRVAVPDLERIHPERNDAALQALADQTQGHYYASLQAFQTPVDDPDSPLQRIVSQDRETILTGTRNREFRTKMMVWLLTWIATCLAIEWIVRRLHRLS